MTWAALQTRTNAAVLAAMGTNVTFDGAAEPVRALFENGYAFGNVGLSGMADSQPYLVLVDGDVPASPVGKLVVCNAVSYQVADCKPDGLGMTRLLLEVAA